MQLVLQDSRTAECLHSRRGLQRPGCCYRPVWERLIRAPSGGPFGGHLPGKHPRKKNSWWDAPGGVASVWGRRPKADELSSPSVKDKPFETCLLQRSGEAWRLWDTRDLRSGPSVALSGDIPVTERLAVFRTRRGPKWAGWVKGSATSGLRCSAAARDASAANTASNPSYHIVESWDIEKMMEEPPTDYYYDRLSEDLRNRHPQADSHLIDHLVVTQPRCWDNGKNPAPNSLRAAWVQAPLQDARPSRPSSR